MPKYRLVIRKSEMHEATIEAESKEKAIEKYYDEELETTFVKFGAEDIVYFEELNLKKNKDEN